MNENFWVCICVRRVFEPNHSQGLSLVAITAKHERSTCRTVANQKLGGVCENLDRMKLITKANEFLVKSTMAHQEL